MCFIYKKRKVNEKKLESKRMAALFWDPDYSISSSPQNTSPVFYSRSEFRDTSLMRSYHHSCYNSPVQDNHSSLDWLSGERVEFTRLNPSRTKDNTGEWHMVTATRPSLGSDCRGWRESLQDQQQVSYNSLPRAHFLQPNAKSSAFSPFTNDFWVKGEDAKNIAESSTNSEIFRSIGRKLHPLTQPGFYSPKIPRSKHFEAGQPLQRALNGSLSANNLKFYANTLPPPCSKTAVLKPSLFFCKPQEVKTSVVTTPPLMRAVISQSSPNSSQSSQENLNLLTPGDGHPIQNHDKRLSKQHNIKLPRSNQHVWSDIQQTSSQQQPERSQDVFSEDKSTKDHQQFPECQFRPDQLAIHSPSLQKASHERFSLIDESSIKPSQCDPDQSHGNLTQPSCSQKLKIQHAQHGEAGDIKNNYQDHVKSQVDMNSKNVFGQPRVIASLRAACSPRSVRRSTVVEDLKKLIVMDDTKDNAQGDSSPPQQKEVGPCSSSQMSGSWTSPLLSSSGNHNYPESPALRPTHLSLQTHPTECWAMPKQAESALWDRDHDPNPEIMPLPRSACDLDWNSLVQAAKAYETQRMATLLSEMSPASSRPNTPSHGTQTFHHSSAYCSGDDTDSDVFIDFPDQLSHMEGMLKRLSSDLLKEKKDKVALLAEVLKLRINNQHLREESFSATAQLHKISKILNMTPEEVE